MPWRDGMKSGDHSPRLRSNRIELLANEPAGGVFWAAGTESSRSKIKASATVAAAFFQHSPLVTRRAEHATRDQHVTPLRPTPPDASGDSARADRRTTKFPHESTVPFASGGRTIVDDPSCTSAGPVTMLPGGIPSRT
jgi:hypothetical protein